MKSKVLCIRMKIHETSKSLVYCLLFFICLEVYTKKNWTDLIEYPGSKLSGVAVEFVTQMGASATQ